MEPKQILQILTEARQYTKTNQYMPAINLFMQVLEEQDTIQLREELIDLLQKVNNPRASAEHCVIIGYRLLSKDDREGALKSFARALKFNMQEYEALEKLTEICIDYPEVPKNLHFNLDNFLIEIFKYHFQNDQYLTVSQAYSSIADLLLKKSPVHQLIAEVFEKKSLPGIPEAKRLEILARIYSIQKKIKKSKKMYERMMALDENASRKSGLLKSVEFLREQQRKERKKWFLLLKLVFLVAFFVATGGSYYSYHRRAYDAFLAVQTELQQKLSQQKLPSIETFTLLQKTVDLDSYAQSLRQLCDFRLQEEFIQKYERDIIQAFPFTSAQSQAQAEILLCKQKPEAIKNDYLSCIQWFQKEIDQQTKQSLQWVQEKKFQDAIELLKKLQILTQKISESSIVLLQKDIEIQITRLQKEYDSYQKFQAKLEEERQVKIKEVQDILQKAQLLIEQEQYGPAFTQHYLPLLQNLHYREVPEVQTLKVPCFFKVAPLPLTIFQNTQKLPETTSWSRLPTGILLGISGIDLQQEQTLTFKSPGFQDISVPCSINSFPSGETLSFKRQTLYQWKIAEPSSAPIAKEDELLFAGRDGKFYRLDLSKPLSELPVFSEKKIAGRDTWSGSPQILQNRVLLSTRKENAYFLEWKTDKIKKYDSKDGFPWGGTTNGKTSFLLAEQTGKLLEFQIQDEKLSIYSKTTLPAAPETAPLYDEKTSSIYIGVSAGMLYSLKNQIGFPVRWKLKIGNEIQNPLLLGEDLLFLKTNSQVIAIQLQDQQIQGQIKWTFPPVEQKIMMVKPISPLTWNRNELFFTDGLGILYCLESRTGVLKWKTEKGAGAGKFAPLVLQKSLFCGGSEPVLFAYERQTGMLLWTHPIQAPLLGFTLLSAGPKTSFQNDLLLVSMESSSFFLFELYEK
ncbi:MAG: PQQ-binding-like beta-propeller repeat protein [Planctomycetota bacterium]